MNNLVTLSFFRFTSTFAKFKVFSNIPNLRKNYMKSSGLEFGKIMGSGSGNGYSFLPDFSVYGALGVWKSEKQYSLAQKDNYTLNFLADYAYEQVTFYLSPYKSHGLWGGKNPFNQSPLHTNSTGKIAVITRARIKNKHLWRFWSKVALPAEVVNQKPGCIFNVGIGEWPIFQQATFSLWNSEKEMREYAYKSSAHKKVIELKRKEKWYSEELFARFKLIKASGRWHDRTIA